MRTIPFFATSVFLLAFVSCNKIRKPDPPINSNWQKLKLRNGWVLYAPKNFLSKPEQGVDSDPGVVYSKKDSIIFWYDTGQQSYEEKDCSFEAKYKAERAKIESGFFKKFYDYPIPYKAVIDTIDNQIAVIVTPEKPGAGRVSISISSCDHAWVGLHTYKTGFDKLGLVLKIFKTLKYEGEK